MQEAGDGSNFRYFSSGKVSMVRTVPNARFPCTHSAIHQAAAPPLEVRDDLVDGSQVPHCNGLSRVWGRCSPAIAGVRRRTGGGFADLGL
jgi:hypothetical protein